MDKVLLTVIIPIYNERINLEKAINSVKHFANQVLIVDSNSTDDSLMVARSVLSDIDIINVPLTESFSQKMNAALINPIIRNNWVMRLDADEVVVEPDRFFETLSKILSPPQTKVGFYLNRRFYFLNRWIIHGGRYPEHALRIWKKGHAFFENKIIDEKMVVNGETDQLNIDIADIDQKGFLNWLKKHLKYAKMEAIAYRSLSNTHIIYDRKSDNITLENKKKYYKSPIFVRPIIYLFYRLIIQKGLKDGIVGCFYHFMHAFVYRELVDFFILKQRVEHFISK